MSGLLDFVQSLMAPAARPYNQMGNMADANAALNLTPQERALYQRHLTNLWGTGGVDNADGSRSSLYQANVTGPDGRSYNIPTVYNGAIITDPKEMKARAAAQGWNTFPSYATPDQAEARYQAMHEFMDKDTGAYFDVRRSPAPVTKGLF